MNPRTLFLLVAVLAAAGAWAGTIPADCDQWSEYPDAAAAEADGWLRECGLAQQVTVSDDCCLGLSSVGCRTTRAYWCDEFGIEKSVSLNGAVIFEFDHKAPWGGWNFAVRIYQQPSVEEAAAGVTEKRLVFNFLSSTEWTHNSFDLADGLWEWRVNNMWQAYGFEENLGDLVSIQWYFCTYFGVAIGDEMLIDGLCFQTDASAVPDADLASGILVPYPNPFNPSTRISFHLDTTRSLTASVFSLDGRLVKELASGVMGPGPQVLQWDGCNQNGQAMASGSYLVVLRGDQFQRSEKLILAR